MGALGSRGELYDKVATAATWAREAEWLQGQLPTTLPADFRLMANLLLDKFIISLGEDDKDTNPWEGVLGLIAERSSSEIKRISSTLSSIGDAAHKSNWRFAERMTQIWRAQIRIECQKLEISKMSEKLEIKPALLEPVQTLEPISKKE